MTAAEPLPVPVRTSVPESPKRGCKTCGLTQADKDALQLYTAEEPTLRIVPREEQIRILIFGRKGCSRCDSAKQKLDDHFKLPYHFIDVTEPPENWRDTDATDVMADACVRDIDITHPPIIGIRGRAYEYAPAMKELKNLTK